MAEIIKKTELFKLNANDMRNIESLFGGWDETLVWSCLQGVMGNAWADRIQNPTSAQIITADFCFFAGAPNIKLAEHIPSDYLSNYILMVPQNDEWAALIEQVYRNNNKRFMRYAIKKEPDIFDEAKLRSYVNKLPSDYIVRKIDEEIFNIVMSEGWSKDFCSQFSGYNDYKKRGLGYVILYNGKVVCGASSYTVYDKGIEIEIDTLKEYRRKGLALVCASKLILDCLNCGIYPSWDAANPASVALAEKLGYHFDKEYVTYEITDIRPRF